MIEILPERVAVDHRAAELQLLDAALELVGRGLGVLHRQMREAGIAVRPLLDFLGQKIVARFGGADRRGDVALGLHAGTGERQHRAGDPGLVHRGEPHLAEIGVAVQKVLALGRRHLGHRRVPVLDESRAQEMLFERDLLDQGVLPRRGHVHRSIFCAFACTGFGLACTYASSMVPPVLLVVVSSSRPMRQASDKNQVQVIARAAHILRALEGEDAGLSLGQIAARVEPRALDRAAHRRLARSREASDRGVAHRPGAARARDPAARVVGARRFRRARAAAI